MARALALAARGLGRTFPNPPVGAVFVRGGRVVGEGFHTRAGAPHAEIEALRGAGRRATGAVLYVTLEPCVHHGRTPPCVDALLPLGLERVVVAIADPDPRVRGRGLARLRRAGVPVVVGVGAAEATLLTAGYRSRVLRGRPLVTLKLATTLDGRIAPAGRPRRGAGPDWITGPAARRRRSRLAWSTGSCSSWRPSCSPAMACPRSGRSACGAWRTPSGSRGWRSGAWDAISSSKVGCSGGETALCLGGGPAVLSARGRVGSHPRVSRAAARGRARADRRQRERATRGGARLRRRARHARGHQLHGDARARPRLSRADARADAAARHSVAAGR